MGKKIVRAIAYKRKRLGKTNYKKRLNLLKSSKLRVVVRGSHNNFIVQLIKSELKGDKVVLSAYTRELIKYGWNKHRGNVPSAYLAGYLLGKKAIKNNINEAILDVGLQSLTKGNRLYAALKGSVDAGLNIPYDNSMLPKEERIKGKHISDEIIALFEKTKQAINNRFRENNP